MSRSFQVLHETHATRTITQNGRDVQSMTEMFSYTPPNLIYGNSPELKMQHYRNIIQEVLLIYTDWFEQENIKRQAS